MALDRSCGLGLTSATETRLQDFRVHLSSEAQDIIEQQSQIHEGLNRSLGTRAPTWTSRGHGKALGTAWGSGRPTSLPHELRTWVRIRRSQMQL